MISENNLQNSYQILYDLIQLGVKNYYISPGMRCAPLVYALEELMKEFDLIVSSVIDERAAAFMALGASKAGSLSACICTSGTAGAHYYPAIIEGFHSQTFFVAITADRPERLRGSDNNQTINQLNLFGSFSQFANIDGSDKDSRKYEIGFGLPLHLNIEFEEPLLPGTIALTPKESMISLIERDELGLEEVDLGEISSPLFIVGGDINLSEPVLSQIIKYPHYFDINANVYSKRNLEKHIGLDTIEGLQFLEGDVETLVHFGGKIISNNYYRYIENNEKFSEIWIANSFPTTVLVERVSKCIHVKPGFNLQPFEVINQGVVPELNLEVEPGWNHLSFVHSLNRSIPDDSKLFIGNSMIVREFNNYPWKTNQTIDIILNRGVSGIDGGISFLRGVCDTTENFCIGVIGDIAALHDFNFQRISEAPNNFKLIILNDFGGSIFSKVTLRNHVRGASKLITTPHHESFSDFDFSMKNEKKFSDSLIEEFINSDKKVLEVILA